MYRQLIKVGYRLSPLLRRLWDAALQGIKTCVRFRGFIYFTVQARQGMEVRILNPKNRNLLGKVVGGELYQCV